MGSLLLEVGVDEIPAGYVKPAIEALSTDLSKKLTDVRVDFGCIENFATPRRLAVLVKNVVQRQKSITELICGPPEKIAFKNDGSYAVPAIKFAERVGVLLSQTEIVTTDKGRYLSVKKTRPVQTAKVLLKTILPELILAIPFPKSMRWGSSSIYFARPIRTVVALLGPEVINFSLCEGINSSRNSTGHSFMSVGTVTIDNPDNYSDIMKKANVIADINERRDIIYGAAKKVALGVGGKIFVDNILLNIVSNLVEFPVVLVGKIDDFFLGMPEEILIAAMREHQKYFAVIDDNEKLLPYFVVVSNTLAKNMRLVAAGHERVLRARLSDAKFFYDADIEDSMDSWVEKLKGVLFHVELGSMYDKIFRIKTIVSYLSTVVVPGHGNDVIRAAYLCKADLVSRVVTEFPKLQGIMGAIYAKLFGESEKIFVAIREHYMPVKSGGELPKTKIGALLSIADKIDSICGCFSIGLVPTGAADPYALRRQAIGLLRIMRFMGFDLTFEELVEKGIEQYADEVKNDLTIVGIEICKFLRNRLYRLLLDLGYPTNVVAAVIGVSPCSVIDVERRVIALADFKKRDEFNPTVLTFKRICNMVRKFESTQTFISEELLENGPEYALYKAYCSINERVELFLNNGDVRGALKAIILLNEPVNLFFDKILVIANNEKLRSNRITMLTVVLEVFHKIADFSQISI